MITGIKNIVLKKDLPILAFLSMIPTIRPRMTQEGTLIREYIRVTFSEFQKLGLVKS